MRPISFSVLAAILVSGCASASDHFQSDAFRPSRARGYRVAYINQDLKSLLGSEWRLDNYMVEGRDRTLKTKGEYAVRRGYDLDGDGLLDEKQEERFYDVLLDHIVRDARIWVRTVPIDKSDALRELLYLFERDAAVRLIKAG